MSELSPEKIEELRVLGELRDSGVVTGEEFEIEKKRILESAKQVASGEPLMTYRPGSHREQTLLSQHRGETPQTPRSFSLSGKRIVVFVGRAYLALISLGVSELIIWAVKRAKTKPQ